MKHVFYKSVERGYQDKQHISSLSNFSSSGSENPGKIGFGLLKALNEYHLSSGFVSGFGLQQNMEVITIVIAGELQYQNNIGYRETVGPDAVLLTSSGSGIGFEYKNTGDDYLIFIELWIEPKLQNIIPRHQYRSLPVGYKRDGLTIMVSNEEGNQHCWINQNCKIGIGRYDAGDHLQYDFDAHNKCIYIFLISGEVHVEDHHLKEKDAVGLWGDNKASVLMVKDSHFILVEVPINH